jgi:UDP-2,3-diacylglucosamine pyrophosphatase LpxH
MTLHYVVSDLHLGMGRWHPLEDFTSDDAFRALLDQITMEGGDELIINGDWIDFPQLEPLDCYPNDKLFSLDGHRLGWTEEDSLRKLESCKAERAHKGFFDDLRAFLKSGKNLTVTMGNHDPDLFWGKVKDELYSLLSPPNREQLQLVQTFTRRGTAHIEHGNQHSTPENKFANPGNVFHVCAQDGQVRLEMVWGTIFMMEFFNDLELSYPFADNVKTHLRALFLGVRNRWLGGHALGKAIKLLWSAGLPWGVLPELLNEEALSPDALIQNLDDQDLARELLDRYDGDAEFRREFDDEILNHTSREEWRSILSATPQQKITLEELTPEVKEVSPTLGIFRDDPEVRAARDLIETSAGVKQVIFGHTHAEIDGASDLAGVRNYFNTGSWVRSMDLREREKRRRLNDISLDDLRDDNLFELRLRFAQLEIAAGGETSVHLRELQPSQGCPPRVEVES